jgi:hypothetical protein
MDSLQSATRRTRVRHDASPDTLSAASLIHEGHKDFRDNWALETRLPRYHGSRWLRFQHGLRRPLPKARGLESINTRDNDTKLFARFTRTVTAHAPIGEYYERFPLFDKPTCCSCPTNPAQSRHHLLVHCSLVSARPWEAWLDANPHTVQGDLPCSSEPTRSSSRSL